MTITKQFPFNTVENYVYDPLKVQITNGEASLLDLGAGTYATDNPSIVFNESIELDSLQLFTETSTKAGLDEVKYTLTRDSVEYYYNSGWIISNGTYAQANTAVEIETNKSSFTAVGIETTIKMFLHSEDGSSTPIVSNVAVDYNFVPIQESVPTTILWWYGKNDIAEDDTGTANISLTNDVVKYNAETTITKETTTITPVDGLYQISIVDTENMEVDASSNEQTYTLLFGGKTFILHIPASAQVNLYDVGIIV